MAIELVHVGFDHFVVMDRVIAVIPRGSPPPRRTKQLIQEAEKRGFLIDTTKGRKAKALLVMDSGHIILSAIAPETIAGRVTTGQETKTR